MKNVLILMLGLVASTASFANTTNPQTAATQSRLVMTTQNKLKLYVAPSQTKGQLAIEDAAGHAIYKTNLGFEKGISQQFDFSGLGTGTYRLTLKTGEQTQVRTFVVQANPNESFVVQAF